MNTIYNISGRFLTVAALMFSILFYSLYSFAATQAPDSNLGRPWYTRVGMFMPQIYVDLYLSSSCPNCLRANEFFKELEKQQAWMIVKRHWIDKDLTALKEFNQELKLFNYEGGYAVPSIFFCKTHWIGFNDVQLSGKMLLKGLNACFTSIYFNGEISTTILNQLQKWSKESQALSHIDSTAKITWATVIIQSAFLDAVTPCSFFVIITFLAFLGLTDKARASRVLVGGLFLITIGIIHYFQLLHWDRYSIWLNNLLPIARVVGGILSIWLLYILWRLRKPYLISIVTAWAVYSYQQQCGFAFPSFYQYWMSSHELSQSGIIASTVLYQLLYLSILGLILGIITVYGIPKPKVLYKISWLILFFIASILILHPIALTSLFLSWIILLIATIMGVIWSKLPVRS